MHLDVKFLSWSSVELDRVGGSSGWKQGLSKSEQEVWHEVVQSKKVGDQDDITAGSANKDEDVGLDKVSEPVSVFGVLGNFHFNF